MPSRSSVQRGRSAEARIREPRRLRRRGRAPGAAPSRPAAAPLHRAEGGAAIRCAACGQPVTSRDQRMSVNGRERHAFVNPAGLVYEIGCFRTAPGCGSVGSSSTDWTWFPGFAWRVALCRRCGAHLGWSYRGASDSFFGLILARLVDDPGPPSP